MHVSDGVFSPAVLGLGWALTAGGLAIGLKRLDAERLPRAGLLAATFFVASLIHVPIGPTSAHLVMNGLAGLLLGWAAFPAIFVGLALQAALFQYGGLASLGPNAFCMAAPAVALGLIAQQVNGRFGTKAPALVGFLTGGLSVLAAALLIATSLAASGEEFLAVAGALVLAHLPVGLAEGVVCGLIVSRLASHRPEALGLAAPGLTGSPCAR
jgi:cobalt/nickel transport system permease protein